ncbi:MAG: hypothetical protein MJA84_14530, partial [Firmicutes bacterium]|nr:hypothetical protein [Bacillota bacterium]
MWALDGFARYAIALFGLSCFAVGQATRAEDDNTIRVVCRGWSDAFHAAAEAYQQDHGDIKFRFDRPDNIGNAWLDGSLALYATQGWLHHSMDGEQQRQLKDLSGKPEVEIIGFTPVVALVHPDNPIDALTVDRLRLIRKMPRRVSWRELGWDRDDYVTRWIDGVFDTAWALLHDKDGDNIRVPIRSRSDPQRLRKRGEILAESRNINAQKRMSYHLNEVLEAVADDPGAIAIVAMSDKALASGLKVLAVKPDGESDPVAMTPDAV